MMDYYRMTLEETIRLHTKGSWAESEYNKLKYTKGLDNASDFEINFVNSLLAGQKFAIRMIVIPKWFIDNVLCGGLLDGYDDGRKNKRLINLVNLTFG